MPSSILKRPRAEERSRDRPTKKPRKFKKQKAYHSSSDEEDDDEQTDFQAVNLQDSDGEEDNGTKQVPRKQKFVADEDDDNDNEEDDSQESGGDDDDNNNDDAASDITGASSDDENANDNEGDLSDEASTIAISEGGTKTKKRHDPTAFATSISKILSSKLTTTKRADPVLSRSATATAISKSLAEGKLEAKARQKIRAERKLALEKGRTRDVLGLETTEESTQGIMERERKLKKTAQRGVVKLFNAVREAQKRGEEARREAQREGVVGMGRREEKVSEMSKKGFLDLIAGGGKKAAGVVA